MQIRGFYTLLLILCVVNICNGDSYCWKRKYFSTLSGIPINATIKCDQSFQWTVRDNCCYDVYDRFDSRPFCCYSETYKLVIAVGIICLILLSASFFLFICWIYNLPHNILYLLTCRKFSLNEWMKVHLHHGPYLDPSFYENFHWSRSRSSDDAFHYPLRPMPPRIFYPSQKVYRWENHGITPAEHQIPLFVLASRQFTRNPYSARPRDERQPYGGSMNNTTNSANNHMNNSGSGGELNSRRSSTFSISENQKYLPNFAFNINVDEVDAASELLEALKFLDEKGKYNHDDQGDKKELSPYIEDTIDIQEEIEDELIRSFPQQQQQDNQHLELENSALVHALRKERLESNGDEKFFLNDFETFESIELQDPISTFELKNDTIANTTTGNNLTLRANSASKTHSSQSSYNEPVLPGYVPERTENNLANNNNKDNKEKY